MKVVFVTSEMVPFIKTGGLADVCGALAQELVKQGTDVAVFLPKYKAIDEEACAMKLAIESLPIHVGSEKIEGCVCLSEYEGVKVYFIKQNEFFDRDYLYGTPQGDYPDNDKRFIFFQKAVLEAVKILNLKPDIIHCHDWQAGLIPAYIRTSFQTDSSYSGTKTIFTIHNMAYQGIFPAESFALTGLSPEVFTVEGIEYYGKINFLKSGLLYADHITTVSERYADEIQLKAFGAGLETVVRNRRDVLTGIVNGIDVEYWNPEKDVSITVPYAVGQFDKKCINKGVLQKENDLPVKRDVPVIGMVTRLADQKGFDILAPILPQIVQMGIQLILLGVGEMKYMKKLRVLAETYDKSFGVNLYFDEKMAHRIYAGSDMFLMPSHYEPCGLGQLIALRYGSVPIVRETGGLADTVIDYNKNTDKGNGFVFTEYTEHALLHTIEKAYTYYQDKKLWRSIVMNGQKYDFSWQKSAQEYMTIYNQSMKEKVSHVQ